MIYIKNDSYDPYYNLAFEEYFFKNEVADDAVLLLWQNSPSVIIGRYQNTIEEINEEFIEANGIKVVRRLTGGGAVYHDGGNLNYSFIVPSEEAKIDFDMFTKPVVEALKGMGLEVALTGRNDIEVSGKKFSGNAQYAHKGKTLHHGTLLFDSDLEALDRALKMKKGKVESKGIKSVRSRVTNLKPFFSDEIDISSFKERLIEHFDRSYGLDEYVLTIEDRRNIELLAEQKYRTWKWTYGESPKCDVVRGGRFKGGYIEFHFKLDKGVIVDAYVHGDFFSCRDIRELVEKFKGIEYEKSAIKKALQNFNIKVYLGGITTEELIEIIC